MMPRAAFRDHRNREASRRGRVHHHRSMVRFATSAPAAVASALLLGAGAIPLDLHGEVARYRRRAEPAIVRELAEFVAIPNLASDLPDIQRNADHLLGMLRARGVQARLLENPGAPPAVDGELPSSGTLRTRRLYAHYDGQPVDPPHRETP